MVLGGFSSRPDGTYITQCPRSKNSAKIFASASCATRTTRTPMIRLAESFG